MCILSKACVSHAPGAGAQRPSDGGNTGNKSVPLCVSFEGMKMVFVLCIDYCSVVSKMEQIPLYSILITYHSVQSPEIYITYQTHFRTPPRQPAAADKTV